jgi:hypothetical protein
MRGDLQHRVLLRATEIMGGEEALRAGLGAQDHTFNLWLTGRARLPDGIFLRIVDLILADDIARSTYDRRKDARLYAPPDSPTTPPVAGGGADRSATEMKR